MHLISPTPALQGKHLLEQIFLWFTVLLRFSSEPFQADNLNMRLVGAELAYTTESKIHVQFYPKICLFSVSFQNTTWKIMYFAHIQLINSFT